MAVRKPTLIKKESDINYIIDLKEEDITMSTVMELFGEFDDKVRFHPYDEILIPPGSYGYEKKNTNSFYTKIGIFIFNRYFIEKDLAHLFPHGYINETINSSMFSKINERLSYALAEDDITLDQLKLYLMKTQKMMPYVSVLSPNLTDTMLTCTEVINKKKEELLKKYEKDIDAGDEQAIVKIEKELLQFAQDYLKDDPSVDIFLSGAKGSWGNNFKNLFIMKGIVKNSDPNAKNKYRIVTSNLIDGVSPEEYAIVADSLVEGPYRRAKKTEIGGEYEKLLLYGLQHVVLDPPDSDCGTKRYIKVHFRNLKDVQRWMYSYVIEGNKLIEITSKNMNEYVGKTVKLRYSGLCESKTGICNKCMGNLEYRRGVKNAGIESTIIASTMKNVSMKSFHNSQQKFTTMDLNKVFGA